MFSYEFFHFVSLLKNIMVYWEKSNLKTDIYEALNKCDWIDTQLGENFDKEKFYGILSESPYFYNLHIPEEFKFLKRFVRIEIVTKHTCHCCHVIEPEQLVYCQISRRFFHLDCKIKVWKAREKSTMRPESDDEIDDNVKALLQPKGFIAFCKYNFGFIIWAGKVLEEYFELPPGFSMEDENSKK